jgi:hypothetical protein
MHAAAATVRVSPAGQQLTRSHGRGRFVLRLPLQGYLAHKEQRLTDTLWKDYAYMA